MKCLIVSKAEATVEKKTFFKIVFLNLIHTWSDKVVKDTVLNQKNQSS